MPEYKVMTTLSGDLDLTDLTFVSRVNAMTIVYSTTSRTSPQGIIMNYAQGKDNVQLM